MIYHKMLLTQYNLHKLRPAQSAQVSTIFYFKKEKIRMISKWRLTFWLSILLILHKLQPAQSAQVTYTILKILKDYLYY